MLDKVDLVVEVGVVGVVDKVDVIDAVDVVVEVGVVDEIDVVDIVDVALLLSFSVIIHVTYTDTASGRCGIRNPYFKPLEQNNPPKYSQRGDQGRGNGGRGQGYRSRNGRKF